MLSNNLRNNKVGMDTNFCKSTQESTALYVDKLGWPRMIVKK
jgi:hypothetical protein